ncbi:ABC transporter substrate-binding protein [Candidatus Poribacteria bacterium]
MRLVCGRTLLAALVSGIMLILAGTSFGAARISVMMSQRSSAHNVVFESFQQAMDRSKATIIGTYDLEGDMESGSGYAGEIRESGSDMVLAIGTTAALVAKEELEDIPIVFCMVLNPVSSGLIENMASPGGNVTGASLDIPLEVQYKYMKLLIPEMRTVGVIYRPEETGILVEAAIQLARSMNISLIAKPVKTESEVHDSLDAILGMIDVLWSVADGTVFGQQSTQHILLTTLRTGMPFMGLSHSFVKAGALFALSCDYADIGKQAAEIADRVLKGENPGDIAVAVPRKISLSINLRTAKHIGLHIPENTIRSADMVIK